MKNMFFLAGILAAAACAPALAADQVINLRAASPAEQLDQVRQALNTDEYSEITPADRRTVLDLIGRMESQIGEGGVEALNEDRRVRLFNWQAAANTILVGAAADSRLVCRREQQIGTRMMSTQCATVAERRRMRDAAEQHMRDKSRVSDRR